MLADMSPIAAHGGSWSTAADRRRLSEPVGLL